MPTPKIHNLLRRLPGVDSLMEHVKTDQRFSTIPMTVLKRSARRSINELRSRIIDGHEPDCSINTVADMVYDHAAKVIAPKLVPLINATGVVLHTNLGRAPLCSQALEAIRDIAAGYSNLEFNIDSGKRGIRYSAVEGLLCELTGAEAAMAVNNNAGAVLLSLDTIANGREVIVSRGELVEIGGSFRIPDVMKKSGGTLKEVGTTNRTHLRDYEGAIGEATGLLLKVHTSNYRIQGFTSAVPLADLVALGNQRGVPVMEDLGSGSLIDFSLYGLAKEPTVQDAVRSGADIITFSGDKLLGGPQAGIILGKKSVIDTIRANPLTRALRIDKLTLAALEATLALYRDEDRALSALPALRMLTESYESVARRSDRLLASLNKAIGSLAELGQADLSSRTGGGAFPELSIPSRCVLVKPSAMSASALEKQLRMNSPAIIGRIEDDRFIIDPRTLQPGEADRVVQVLHTLLSGIAL